MFIILNFIFISFFISFLIYFLGFFLGFFFDNSSDKISPFECGFDSFEFFRNPFSIRFFLISVQFLIFDIEIVLVFPFPLGSILYYFNYIILSIYLFITIVSLGFFHEWNEGSLDWK